MPRFARYWISWTRWILRLPAAHGYRYACFDNFGEDTQAYGYATSFGLSKSCENEVISQWMEMRQRARISPAAMAASPGMHSSLRNKMLGLVKNAEEYYRSMFHGRVSSWNLRDTHMAETLGALTHHLGAKCEDRRLGAQFSSWRCQRHGDGATGRT